MLNTDGSTKTLIVKILFPALVAVAVKIAVIKQTEKISWKAALLSVIIGVGTAYLCADLILNDVPEDLRNIVVGIIAIVSDKAVTWLMKEFNVGQFLSNFFKQDKR